VIEVVLVFVREKERRFWLVAPAVMFPEGEVGRRTAVRAIRVGDAGAFMVITLSE
jgi:hypothetical protein